MEGNGNALARLVRAIGAEMLRLGLELTELQKQLACTGWDWPASAAAAGQPVTLGSADVERIVALQELDRLTQTATALGSLGVRVAAYSQDRQQVERACAELSEVLRHVPLVSLRDRLAQSLEGRSGSRDHSDAAAPGFGPVGTPGPHGICDPATDTR